MSPRRLFAALALAAACASCAGAQRLEREGNATLTGVVVPPPGGAGGADHSCTGVTARVEHTGEPGSVLGSVMVKQLRGRCLFVVSNLPSDAELRLTVSPGTSWRCEDGQPPSLKPVARVLKLRDYETATRDFRATCQ